jgi:hypothetical protein
MKKTMLLAFAHLLFSVIGHGDGPRADGAGRDTSVAIPRVVSTSPRIKVGILAQIHAQAAQEQTSAAQDADPSFDRHWMRQIYVRRLRLLLSGSISENTSFFFDSDAPNIGKVDGSGGKPSKVQMYVQDAQIQHTVVPEFGVIAGLQLVGTTRNSLQGAASLMSIDYGAYQFVTSGPLDNNVGRDLGVNFRGFLASERLEYRAGIFSGRNFNLYSPLRTTVRINYAFKDREKGFFYTGTSLGKSEILSLGAGLDAQGGFCEASVDGFADMAIGETSFLTLSASLSVLDGGGSDVDSTFFTSSIPKQSIVFAEAGWFNRDWGVQPLVKYESQSVHATVLKQVGATEGTLALQNSLRSSKRLGIGVNYFSDSHNASVKVLYEQILLNRASLRPGTWESSRSGQLTIQIQYYSP